MRLIERRLFLSMNSLARHFPCELDLRAHILLARNSYFQQLSTCSKTLVQNLVFLLRRSGSALMLPLMLLKWDSLYRHPVYSLFLVLNRFVRLESSHRVCAFALCPSGHLLAGKHARSIGTSNGRCIRLKSSICYEHRRLFTPKYFQVDTYICSR